MIGNKTLVASVTFATYTLLLFAPLELYLMNREELKFPVSSFVWILLLIFVSTCAVLILVGYTLRGRLKEIYVGGVFLIGLCVYIQGNFLNLKLGIMNGQPIDWGMYKYRYMFDFAVWLLVGLLLLLVYRKSSYFEKIVFYLSLFFVLIQTIALLVLIIPLVCDDSASNDTNYMSSDYMLEVGTQGNILVIILDMFDDEYFKSIMDKSSDIISKLEGFTYYNNNAGQYNTTNYSMMYILNGDRYLNEVSPFYEWINAHDHTYLDDIIDDGYEVTIYSVMGEYIPERIYSHIKNFSRRIQGGINISNANRGKLVLTMYRLGLCKYAPNVLKQYIWMSENNINDLSDEFDPSNRKFRDMLRENGVTTVEGKQVKFIHITGVHYPYEVDEMGEDFDYDTGEWDLDAVYEDGSAACNTAMGVMRITEEYLEDLKQLGLYDKSDIIITADHGYYGNGVLSNPVLLVKPRNSKGELQVSNAPVGQSDIPATIMDFAGLNEGNKWGESVLNIEEGDKRDRFFYQYYLCEDSDDQRHRLIEYSIPYDSNNITGFKLSGKEYSVLGDEIDHFKYCKSCQEDSVKSIYKGVWYWKHIATKSNPSYKYIRDPLQ